MLIMNMMDNNSAEFTLPHAPRGLCFDRNDFVKTNFSVDSFLAEHQNAASLETMRDDLGVYLKVLRLAMIELINKDYANFVNLCATLIGFDKAILKIQVPLEQLNEEVLSVKKCLEEAMKELSMWLSQRHTLFKKKQLLKYFSQTINSLSSLQKILINTSDKELHEKILLVDRASMQYNQLKFTVSKCDNILNPEHRKKFKEIGEKLTEILNDLLFEFWNINDEEGLLKALIILSNLDQVNKTEKLLRKKAVAPLLLDMITESNLQKDKDGLCGIYNRILSLLETKLKLLLKVTEHSDMAFLVKRYRFFVNCFWCEVETKIEVNLASIFAPGNPQIFYKRYCESIEFINKVERYCSDEETIKLLHDTPEYKSFQKRWNLPVYFQIRFQEIAGEFETALQYKPTLENNNGFILKQSSKCWEAVISCWSDGIYIDSLGYKFWKLTLQIFSRYATWGIAVSHEGFSSRKLDPTNVNKNLLNNSINIILDTTELLQRFPDLLKLLESKFSNNINKQLLQQSLSSTEKNLDSALNKVKENVVMELYDYCNIHLKQVSDIPRLYRKTNRSIPTKPCTYIDVINKSLQKFHEDVSQRLNNVILMDLLEKLFNIMTISYYKYVEDVLISVQKTEDSLRRLKQIREQASSQSSDSVGVTDGDKIRLQLNVDILSYGKLAESLAVNVNNVCKYKDLCSMVTETVKNIHIK